MPKFIIRRAQATDDLLQIASCIYRTDPFIYPAAFGQDSEKAAHAISVLMRIENGLFHTDNIIIALNDDQVCGALLYNREGAQWDHCQCTELVKEIVPDIKQFEYVSHKYFHIESARPEKDHIEIVACCVMPEFRNLGIGRGMLNYLAKQFPAHIFTLDVIANNLSAVTLYHRCNFETLEGFRGFSIEEATRPDCYHMVRKPIVLEGENHEQVKT